jgi:hypothetical protein
MCAQFALILFYRYRTVRLRHLNKMRPTRAEAAVLFKEHRDLGHSLVVSYLQPRTALPNEISRESRE